VQNIWTHSLTFRRYQEYKAKIKDGKLASTHTSDRANCLQHT